MKIAYITSAHIPSRWANSFQVMKMAQAFHLLGHEVEFITASGISAWLTYDSEAIREHYGVTTPFPITMFPVSPLVRLEKKLNCGPLSYGHLVARLRKDVDLVYARNYVAPYWSARLGIPTIAESHACVDGFYQKQLLYKATSWPSFKALVTNSPELAKEYARTGVPEHKILAEQNGVDLSLFDSVDRSKVETVRHDLMTVGTQLVVYAGHLYDYKGMPTILDAAERLPHVSFALVGGWENDVDRLRAQAAARGIRNLTLTGFVQNNELPPYLKAADLLLLPNSGNHAESSITSPLKLFEYMATGTPILASNIQNVAHVLRDGENGYLCEPDSGEALARAIVAIGEDKGAAVECATQARRDVSIHSYLERVKRILSFAGFDAPVGATQSHLDKEVERAA